MLFDVGEGTQRQMMRYGTGFDISDILLTHLHGDHIYGLPGLLETWSFNDREDPLTIHVPAHCRSDVVSLITACGGDPSYPVRINEVGANEVAIRTDEYQIHTIATEHRVASVGYVLIEDERKGRFDREAAEELGVPAGPAFSQLHEGVPVELDDGRVIKPEQVVGPPRPGRKLVYSGDTRPATTVEEAAQDADLLIHDATFSHEHQERAIETYHSTAKEAAELAQRAGVKELILTHISSRHAGDTTVLANESKAAYSGTVRVAYDGLKISISFPGKQNTEYT